MDIKAKADEAKTKLEDTAQDLKDKAKSALDGAGATDDLETLKTDLKNLRADVSSLMHSLKGAASSTAHNVGDDLKHTGGQLGEQVMDALGTVKDKGSELTSSLEGHVQDRPLISVLVAFGLGLVLSRMLERR